MKIYTRVGDDGGTALFGGQRVRKSALRVVAYGAVDEANSTLGLARSAPGLPESLGPEMERLMSDLFDLGAELATPPEAGEKLASRLQTEIDAMRIETLERLIDDADAELAPLTSFVLPTGVEAAARLHVARTVTRRAEREVVALVESGEPVRREVIAYLNRLGDLLFTWARLANHRAGLPDVAWQARKHEDAV